MRNFTIILMILMIFLTAGCSDNTSDNNISYKKQPQFNMAENFEYETYVIESSIYDAQKDSSADGYNMEVFVVDDYEAADTNFERWLAVKEEAENQKKYDALRKIWQNENNADFAQLEQERIEQYCREYGFSKCRNIDRTCESDGCHKVIVRCDDDSYKEYYSDPDRCRKFKVTVEENIDSDLTEEIEAEEDKKNCW